MSHGLPDWYRGVDIAYQALAEMITRPKYGAAQVAEASEVVDASGVTELISITGKGMIYGGALWMDYTSTQKDSSPLLTIDGNEFRDDGLYTINFMNWNNPLILPISILKYDDTNFVYCVGFAYGYTFETSVLVSYSEKHGTTPTVNASLYYALI